MKQTILGYNQEMIVQMIYQTTNIDISNDNSYDSSFSLFSPGPIVHRLVVKKKHGAPTKTSASVLRQISPQTLQRHLAFRPGLSRFRPGGFYGKIMGRIWKILKLMKF